MNVLLRSRVSSLVLSDLSLFKKVNSALACSLSRLGGRASCLLTSNVANPTAALGSPFSTAVAFAAEEETITRSTGLPEYPPGWELLHNPPRAVKIRGTLVGTVVSDKMQKTVNVAVDRFRVHQKYGKRLRFTRKFFAHDEEEVCNMGDMVMIVPDRRRSRHKHFRVHEIIKAKGVL
jgi:small subunit ribosomal protein S17